MTERITYHNPKFIEQDILLRKPDNKLLKEDGVRNIAVTFLTLETGGGGPSSAMDEYGVPQVDDEIRQKSKFLHQFRVRRKHNSIKKTSPSLQKDDMCLELGLLGKGYLNDKNNGKPEIPAKTKDNSDKSNLSGSNSATQNILGLPALSSRSSRTENTTLANIHKFSYLDTDFGFGKYRTDTFTGVGLHSNRYLCDFQSRLAVQANRHLEACTTVGMVGKRSRAAQNVLGLKRTIEEGVVIEKYVGFVPISNNPEHDHRHDSQKLKSYTHNGKSRKHNKQSLPFICGNSCSNTE